MKYVLCMVLALMYLPPAQGLLSPRVQSTAHLA
jgi:hypothetical protein